MLLAAPPGVLGDLPPGVVVKSQRRGQADVVVAFFTELRRYQGRVDALGKAIYPVGALWIAWPKKASGVATDISHHGVREAALPLGLVDNKVCAIDETWTGLRFVWRVERR